MDLCRIHEVYSSIDTDITILKPVLHNHRKHCRTQHKVNNLRMVTAAALTVHQAPRCRFYFSNQCHLMGLLWKITGLIYLDCLEYRFIPSKHSIKTSNYYSNLEVHVLCGFLMHETS